MEITQNCSLQNLHSFGSNEKANYFASIDSIETIEKGIQWANGKNIPYLILGSGTNVLFTKPFEGLVLKMEIMGIKKIKETASEVFLEVGAGENWHHFVIYCIQKSWGGLENLSFIPGTVGAAPIQNIGAYGVEVKDSIESVTAYDTQVGQIIILENRKCAFAYRTSLFKMEQRRYIIISVQFILQKQPIFRTEYGAIKEVLHQKNNKQHSLEAISNAVIQIRSEKFPDIKKIGNAGSFFKNPTITKELYEALIVKYPKMIAYPITDDTYKIAATWLMEACGWKGVQKENVGCYEKQTLVIVHYNNGPGIEIYNFSEEIIQSVLTKFNILLEREVMIY
ncbi:MAG: UDP-N-acetylmuramate dehydrogenase [Chitinophagia bacterium]|jgi:UDP-N-acetylmuramate dehydrogenase|nr:UDP-N-acetylmuramate dehydrogenase [Chitinophagia bacterium]NCA30428.1 UDP-N-acetylmuramate dehydrogenase [Chitinophagia bacterium]